MPLAINEKAARTMSRLAAHRLITMRLRLLELWREVTGGHEESLVLMAVIAITGDRASGRILWEWQGPANLSMPAIADLDDDGFAEILVQAADGSVHCIGSAPP